MCEFCEKGLDVELEQKEISIGFLGDIKLSLEMEMADSTGYGENNINAWLEFNDTNSRVSMKINYCPMCGRELSEVNNNDY